MAVDLRLEDGLPARLWIAAPDWFPEMGDPEIAFVNIDADTFSDESFQFRAGHAYIRDDFGLWEHNYFFGIGGSIGPGVAMANFADDAEVWAHEQGHAIISELTPFDDTDLRAIDEQFEAIHEGLADCTAVAYTGDPAVLEFVIADVEAFAEGGPCVFEVRVASTGRQLSPPAEVEVIPCGTGCCCTSAPSPYARGATLVLLLVAGARRRRLVRGRAPV